MEMGRTYKMLRAMESILAEAREESAKFDRGNMLAGKRVRKGLQEVKKKAQEVRMLISAIKKGKKENEKNKI